VGTPSNTKPFAQLETPPVVPCACKEP
jgi:hypothetical protein